MTAPDTIRLGDWQDPSTLVGQILSRQTMILTAGQLVSAWRRCSLSSDFWARYASLFSKRFDAGHPVQREALESAVSYLLNELFENCAKFSSASIDTVKYESWVMPGGIVIQLTNHILPEKQAGFVELMKELLDGDPDELYFRKLEQNAESDQAGSGLGYLSLMKDYNIRFGFRFYKLDDRSTAVDVQAHINIKEI
ncbi:MAG: hypothetical protein FJZ96_02835 [Chloroflexi bacterium]|nr:hypothetical protein [Chloroflexota bacterium]